MGKCVARVRDGRPHGGGSWLGLPDGEPAHGVVPHAHTEPIDRETGPVH